LRLQNVGLVRGSRERDLFASDVAAHRLETHERRDAAPGIDSRTLTRPREETRGFRRLPTGLGALTYQRTREFRPRNAKLEIRQERQWAMGDETALSDQLPRRETVVRETNAIYSWTNA